MAHAERLKQTMQMVLDHQANWNQSSYQRITECGTEYCFAGFAVLLKRKMSIGEEMLNSFNFHDEAKEFLELNWIESLNLFNTINSLEDLQRIVNRLTGENQ